MPFSGIVDADQLSMLTKVLDDHCNAQGIYDDIDRDTVAERILFLFQAGVESADKLSAALAHCRPTPS
jgi:hypothetical protein